MRSASRSLCPVGPCEGLWSEQAVSPQPLPMPLDHSTPKVLFSSCSFDLLSGVSLTARRVSWHPPGKITVNPEVADPLWGTFQPLRLVCYYSYLDREFLWLLSCPGAVSSKDTIPCCLREEVSLVSVQIPKSWFHCGPQTECFKAALNFSSASSMSKILVSWFGFVLLSDRNAGKL